MNAKKARYNYRSKLHRDWAAGVKAGHNGCVVCGRGKPSKRTGKPRKGQRLHAHHVFGTGHSEGVVLCPTCHKLIDTLAGPGRGVFESVGKRRKLFALVRDKIRGGPVVDEAS